MRPVTLHVQHRVVGTGNPHATLVDLRCSQTWLATFGHGAGNYSGTRLDIADLVRDRQARGQEINELVMSVLGKIIREPLLHFLLLGGGLFLLFNMLNSGTIENPRQV